MTGNTTMRIDAGMDTGEMLLQQEMAIGRENFAGIGGAAGGGGGSFDDESSSI